MAAVVSIIIGRDLSYHTCHKNKVSLVLYKLLLYCNSHLKQLYIRNKLERFSFEGRLG